MQNNNHTKFILTPLTMIVDEAVNACKGLGYGIETYSLSEYVFQTTFLKMTGASEQKLKCICWDCATYDYDYRYRFLKKNYGECSRYEDINIVYSDLKKVVMKVNPSFTISYLLEDINITKYLQECLNNRITKAIDKEKKKKCLSDEDEAKMIVGVQKFYRNKELSVKEKQFLKKRGLLDLINKRIISILDHSVLSIWRQYDYELYKKTWNDILLADFATETIFDDKLRKNYITIVYNHRNRCAHNLTSYQENLPTLKTLIDKSHCYNNYFFRFAILILIDEIFMRLYRHFLLSINKGIY